MPLQIAAQTLDTVCRKKESSVGIALSPFWRQNEADRYVRCTSDLAEDGALASFCQYRSLRGLQELLCSWLNRSHRPRMRRRLRTTSRTSGEGEHKQYPRLNALAWPTEAALEREYTALRPRSRSR